MSKLIQISGTDYYDCLNPVIAVDGFLDLNPLMKDFNEDIIAKNTFMSFADWLVANDYARWPYDDEYDDFDMQLN